jgi:DnaJ-domain-containing protein 1
MFERNRVDNAAQLRTVEVELTLDDGQTIAGRIKFPVSRSLTDALNGQDYFIDFEPFVGETLFLAKSSLRAVRRLNVPAGRALPAQNPDVGFDPLQVLGVEAGADAESLRQAFVQKSKAYHPDRFAHVELPEEVREYLQAKARRVNAAYDILQAALPAVKPKVSEPVWESRRSA